ALYEQIAGPEHDRVVHGQLSLAGKVRGEVSGVQSPERFGELRQPLHLAKQPAPRLREQFGRLGGFAGLCHSESSVKNREAPCGLDQWRGRRLGAPNADHRSTNDAKSSATGSNHTGGLRLASCGAFPWAFSSVDSASVTRPRAAVSVARTLWHFGPHALSVS